MNMSPQELDVWVGNLELQLKTENQTEKEAYDQQWAEIQKLNNK